VDLVFPTPVGMNRAGFLRFWNDKGVPHACGDEPWSLALAVLGIKCSPRLWG